MPHSVGEEYSVIAVPVNLSTSRNIAEGCLTSSDTKQDKAVRQNEEGTENWLFSFVYCESTPVLSVLKLLD